MLVYQRVPPKVSTYASTMDPMDVEVPVFWVEKFPPPSTPRWIGRWCCAPVPPVPPHVPGAWLCCPDTLRDEEMKIFGCVNTGDLYGFIAILGITDI